MQLSFVCVFVGLIPAAYSAAASCSAGRVCNAFGEPSYGVDVSFPIHHGSVLDKDDSNQPLGDRQKFYRDFMSGCREHYKKTRPTSCDVTDADRVAMSLRQPASVQNYTDTGFKKVRAPKEVFELITEHWNTNVANKKKEEWPSGNTYTNHWNSPTYMVSVEDSHLRGGGQLLKQKIWDGVKPVLEEWTGMELAQSSLYGIRQYTEGAILSPHADRMPLISSCIINVAQDVEEDWPLEVYGRDGLAYNVTMEPGDMVLYESHSLIHGRPFPLKGNYFANIFVHFQPTGKLLRERDTPVLLKADDDEAPIYIRRGSQEENKWLAAHLPSKHDKESPAAAPLNEVAHAAMTGDVETISEYAAANRHLLHKKDANGWQPIHEAARGGHMMVVEILVAHGADVNERTGAGNSVLNLVLENHGEDHPLVDYLRNSGAVDLGPDL